MKFQLFHWKILDKNQFSVTDFAFPDGKVKCDFHFSSIINNVSFDKLPLLYSMLPKDFIQHFQSLILQLGMF